MKHSFLFGILSVVTLLSFGQINDDNSFFSNSYDRNVIKKNKIDSITVTILFPNKQSKRVFCFDTLGNLTYSVTYDESGNKTNESFLSYNRTGQLVSRKDTEEMIDDNTTFFYNQERQLDKAVKVNKAKETIVTTYVYKNQKLIEETRKEKTSKLVSRYEYDSKGRVINLSTVSFHGSDKKGTVALHKSIFYDNKGNKTSEEVLFLTKDTVTYKYDDRDRLISIQEGDNSKKYYYDERGLLSKNEVVKMLIDTPFSYSELYEYAVRQ